MDSLQTLFLERPIWLGIFSFLLFAITLFVRRRISPPKDRYALPGVLALIAVLFLFQSLIVTQRETLGDNIEEVARAFEKKNTLAIMQFIDVSFDSKGMDRDGFQRYVESLVQSVSIGDVRFLRREVTVNDAEAEMTVTARATVSIRGEVGDFHWGTWVINWRKDSTGWKITRITPRILDGMPVDNLQQLRGYVPSGG